MKGMTLKFLKMKLSFSKVSLWMGVGMFCINPGKKNCFKLKINQRTSLWMHPSPTTIRDLISCYFKSSVRNLFLFPVEKKDKPCVCIPTHFLSKNLPNNSVISLTPTWFNVVPLVQMLSITPWTILGLCRFLLQNITCHLLP